MGRDKKQVIDEVFYTLFENDARGYVGIDKVALNTEAEKFLKRTIATLDPKERGPLENDANYRLALFRKFQSAPMQKRDDAMRIAKERHLPVEKAYELSDAARS